MFSISFSYDGPAGIHTPRRWLRARGNRCNELAFSFDSCRIPNKRSLSTQGISVLIWYEFYFFFSYNTHPSACPTALVLPFALTT